MSNKLIDLNALSDYKTRSDSKYQNKLTAGDSITISNSVISVTPYLSGNLLSGTKSVANNTIVSFGSVTLTPGNYIISYTCAFTANSTGYRQCGFSTNTTDITGFGRGWGDNRVAAPGVETITCVSGSFKISASDYPNGQTFYFLAKQNSGSSLSAYPRCRYLKF